MSNRGTHQEIRLDKIEREMALQPRATLDRDCIEEYAREMAEGAEFPPVVVFFDGSKHWLADGFHRLSAAEAAGCGSIMADVREGTYRDALLYSVGANAVHGLRRTNEDKRRAVDIMLDDPEWWEWSDREIARRCAVDNSTVTRRRQELSVAKQQIAKPEEPERQKRKAKRGGKTIKMDTSNIGQRRRVVEEPQQTAAAELSPPVVEPCDRDAVRLSERAMSAIRTLAELPPAADVLAAWKKTTGYEEPVETLKNAIAWLEAFTPLYCANGPERWARVQAAATAHTGLFADAAE